MPSFPENNREHPGGSREIWVDVFDSAVKLRGRQVVGARMMSAISTAFFVAGKAASAKQQPFLSAWFMQERIYFE